VTRLFLRAMVALLVLPGIIAFAVPLTAFGRVWPPTGMAWSGIAVLGAGITILGGTIREFFVQGRGTLAPWAPPVRLVRSGLYRWSRNPMYVGVVCIVLGWTLLFRSPAMLLYDAGLAIAFHLRVVLGEEPWLARTFGAEWDQFAAEVPRWFGRRRVRRSDDRR